MSIKIREKKLKDGSKSLYLDLYTTGRRQYEFLGLYLSKNKAHNKETKELAESIRSKRQLELQASGFGLAPQFKKQTDFIVYFETVFKYKKEKEGLRDDSNYTVTLKHLKDYSKGKLIQIGAIDVLWIENFRVFLSKKGIKGNTINNYFNRVKAVLNRAVIENYISKNPASTIKYYPSPEVEKVFLVDEEISNLISTPCKKPDIKLAFLFSCNTGLRFSDVKKLTWGQIKDNQIHFRQQKTQGFEYMPLNDGAIKLLDKTKGDLIPMPEKPIFTLPSKSHVNVYLKEWVKDAKIDKKVTFHVSRHTFATDLITKGTDIYTVSKLMGHKSIATTTIYAKIVDAKKIKAVNNLTPIGEIA